MDSDTRLLLIRVRPSFRPSALAGFTSLDIEALIDGSIYPSASVDIDLAGLQSLLFSPANAYGQLLGERLSSAPPLREALNGVKLAPRFRIQLMLDPVAGPHHAIRWERLELPILFGERIPVALRQDTPFSRFAAVNIHAEEAPEDQLFHLLVVVASPAAGLEPISAAAECRSILDACQELLADGQMRITLMPGRQGLPPDFSESIPAKLIREKRISILDGDATAENVRDQIVNGVQGIHIIAHGTYNSQKNEFYLFLENEMGPSTASELLRLWDVSRIRLLFLQACQSAVALPAAFDPRPHLNSFMHQLVAAGAPGVIAMQDFIRMEDAREFHRGFYTSLIREGLADVAVNQGRRLLIQTADAAWAIPALTTRLKDGAVWRESPLRAAQRQLFTRLKEDHEGRYPPFPIDVVPVSSETMIKRAVDPLRDDLESVSAVDAPSLDANVALTEAVSKTDGDQVICLVAGRGRAKSAMLEDLYLREVKRHWDGEQPAVPVMLRLRDCACSSFNAEKAIAQAIAEFFSDRAGAGIDPEPVQGCFRKERFLFLIDGDDDMGDELLGRAINQWKDFREVQRSDDHGDRHQYVVTLDQNAIKVADLPNPCRCLFVQPMEADRIRKYLAALPAGDEKPGAGKLLLGLLEEAGLFDLAEAPWLLSEMLGQAHRNVLETSRANILRRVVDERISRVIGPAGIRSRAKQLIYELAWRIQINRQIALPGTDCFELMAELRGNRDYPLGEFRSQLIQASLMASSGEDGIRFAYQGFRSYCCAQYLLQQPEPVLERLLSDITATLGRPSRAKVWQETLYILAGLWDKTGTLLRMILSGASLHEGEQVNIAARCLQESRQGRNADRVDASDKSGRTVEDPVVRSIVSALIYRSHPVSLRSVSSRKRALYFLGPLQEQKAMGHMISIVLDKVRPDAAGVLQYDYSGVRLAAVKALLFMPHEQVIKQVRDTPNWSADAELHDTLEAWLKGDLDRLRSRVRSKSATAVISLAAFALGLTRLPGALDALMDRFNDDTSKDWDSLWAVTDSLLELKDPNLSRIVSAQLNRADRQLYIAYLIGQIGTAKPGSPEWTFLTDRLDHGDHRLRGRALLALAELDDSSMLGRCHAWLAEQDASSMLRYFALQALRLIGNEESLVRLEGIEWGLSAPDKEIYPLFLERLRLEVYEEIYWRLAGGLSREVMVPMRYSTGPEAHKATGA